MNGSPHRRDADARATLSLPRVDAVDEPLVGIRLEMLPQPHQIHSSRIVAASRLVLDVPGLPVTSQHSTHGRLANPEQLSRRGVRTALLGQVCRYQSLPKIDRCLRHPNV